MALREARQRLIICEARGIEIFLGETEIGYLEPRHCSRELEECLRWFAVGVETEPREKPQGSCGLRPALHGLPHMGWVRAGGVGANWD
jgi:hypothetical protein